MDNLNKSIVLDKVTSFDVNTAIQRSLTKACARHGLGLYIYAGEDLPDVPAEEKKEEAQQAVQKKAEAKPVDEIAEAKKLIEACKTKADVNTLFVKKHWVANTELIKYAQSIAANLPEK